MEWIEGRIETTSEAVDAVGDMLTVAGITGFIIEDDNEMKQFLQNSPQNWDYVDDELLNKEPSQPLVKFYVPANANGREILTLVKSGLARLRENDYGLDMGRLALEMDNVDDVEWLEKWKKYYTPFQIGKRVIVRPVWEEYDNTDGKLVFTINPGNVFGTGLHQSTKLCVEALENLVKPGQSILDLGCGSGILGIISMMLGAKSATLLDIDPAAHDTVRENAELNNIDLNNLKVITGNVLTDKSIYDQLYEDTYSPGNKYDIVISNIVADVIISLAPVVAELIADGGIFISSGIIDERTSDVILALQQYGFTDISVRNLEGWVGVTCVFSRTQAI